MALPAVEAAFDARVIEAAQSDFVRPSVAAYDIALIYAALGDTENTFLWLDRAVEDRSTMMTLLAQDPMFDALHADRRFGVLVRRIGVYGRALPEAKAGLETG